MRFRSGEKLPVYLQDGCPMLPYGRGMELLYEVEEFNRRKIKLRLAVVNPQPDRDQEEAFMSRLARLFPEVPLRLLERVLGKFKYNNDVMGFNRRIRRQVDPIIYVFIVLVILETFHRIPAKGLGQLLRQDCQFSLVGGNMLPMAILFPNTLRHIGGNQDADHLVKVFIGLKGEEGGLSRPDSHCNMLPIGVQCGSIT